MIINFHQVKLYFLFTYFFTVTGINQKNGGNDGRGKLLLFIIFITHQSFDRYILYLHN